MSKQKTNKKTKKVIAITVVLGILVFIALSCLLVARIYFNGVACVDSKNKDEIAFTISNGEYGDNLLEHLYNEGLIKNKKLAKVWIYINKPNSVYSGNYILNQSMSVREIYGIITNEKNAIVEEVDCQILPGDWAQAAANKIADATNLTFSEIWDKWNDVDYVYSLIDKYPVLTENIFNSEHCYLEGYIFPETYRFYKTTTVEQVTEKIIFYTNSIYLKYKDQIEATGYNVHQIFTLASILQFESGSGDDIYTISGVFYNRLKSPYVWENKLQSSVTVCYALYNYESASDCESYANQSIDSKYNTYVYTGLPIGPICNMTEKCIDAACNPEKTDYFYFIGINGKTYFSKTLEEHNKLIAKYLR